MGLFLRSDENRSQLQSKIIADLHEKVRSTSSPEGQADFEDAKILENQHQTRTAGVVIALLVLALVAVAIFVATRSQQ